MRVMDTIKSDFAGQSIEFLAVSVFEDAEAASKFVESSSYDFDWGHMEVEAAARIGVESVPSLIVVDGNGNVAWRSGLLTPFRGGTDVRGALSELTGG